MKTRAAIVPLSAALAIGLGSAVSPAWAQGSEEYSANGGGHPGQSIGPRSGMRSYAQARRHARASHSRGHARDLHTTGKGRSTPTLQHRQNESPNGTDSGTK